MYRRKPQGWLKHIDFIFLDVVSLLISFFCSILSRYGINHLNQVDHYQQVFSFYCLIVILLHIVNNTFSNVLKKGYYKEFASTLSHVLLSTMIITCYLFTTKVSAEYSRIVIYLLTGYYLIISYVFRLVWKRVIRKKGYLFASAALYVVTTKDRASEILKTFKEVTKGEYRIQGICIIDEDFVGTTIEDVPVNSNVDSIVSFLCDKWIDEVYMSFPLSYPVPNQIIDDLVEMGIVVHVNLEKVGSESWQIRQVQKIGKHTVQTISITNISTRQALLKRMIDIFGGIIGCILTLLLTILLGPIIYAYSPGPIFFEQVRVGKNGKKFKMYKFRSMCLNAEDLKKDLVKKNMIPDGMMFKVNFDPRIIGCKVLPDGTIKKGIGNFIREHSLDEFPQFFNVLKGDLSLVGTRPPTVDEWEKYKLHHRSRLAIKPGITGLWQISGRSRITDFEEVVELDKKYIREWSIGLDLRILVKTVFVVLKKDGSM